MGLSASMWTSVSGLLAHGNKMNVVGNNIANVSTIGFKSQRMDFNDYLYISGGSTSGPTQIGAGVSTYAVIGDFSQGSLESTNSVTDIAIDGEGFFKVRQPNSEQCYYTRAGDFYFNADRQLQNPEGYYLQGWKIDNSTRLTFKSDSVNLGTTSGNESAFQGTGTPVDIVLDSWYLEPQRTSSVSFTMGLTSDGKSDKSTSTNSPMTALFDQWDATKNPPMADTAYATSSTIKVYDESGTPHTLSVYYDQVATSKTDDEGNLLYQIEGLPAGYTMYEYVVTIPPEEDMRSFGGTRFNEETNQFDGTQPTQFYNDPVAGTNKNAGMLMTGHLIFDAAGNLVNQSAYTYGANADISNMDQCAMDPAQLGSWQATKFSSNGLPVFCANFTGQPLANSVNEKLSNDRSQAQDYLIELDFGLRTANDWNYSGSLSDLVGGLEAPATNTETRISLATTTAYHKVTFSKSPAQWNVTDTTVPDLMQDDKTKVSEQSPIYLQIDSDTRVQIAYDKNGPKVIYVDPDTGKTMSIADYQGLQTKIEDLEQQIEDARAEIADIETNQLPAAEADVKFYQSEVDGWTDLVNVWQGKVEDEEKKVEDWQTIIDSLEALAEANPDDQDVATHLKDARNSQAEAKQNLADYKKELDNAATKRQLANTELTAANRKLANFEKQIAKLNDNIDDMQNDIIDYSEQQISYGTAALEGIDGKPVRDADKDIVSVTLDPDGNLEMTGLDFVWERNLKTVPNSVLSGDYQRVDSGEMSDIDLSETDGDGASKWIYAMSDGGRKLEVRIDDDGLVTGVRAQGAIEWEDYTGQKLYFEHAVASRVIDYNKDVSVYNDPIRGENATQAGSSSFVTQDSTQNGYASGVLSGTNITTDGVVYGYYDNGETVPLYQIALYDFHNKQGLRREGGNLYAATKESGEPRQGVAGENGFGVTRAYNIEQSNVDMSREFVNMITTQRGFQANSKGITTVDTMLETVIGMKR